MAALLTYWVCITVVAHDVLGLLVITLSPLVTASATANRAARAKSLIT